MLLIHRVEGGLRAEHADEDTRTRLEYWARVISGLAGGGGATLLTAVNRGAPAAEDTWWISRVAQGAGLPVLLLVFSALYFLAAKLGIATSLPPEGVVIVWPPNAIVLAALLLVEKKNWWFFFAVTVATEVAADVPEYPLWAAVGYGVVNFSEAAFAAFLLSRFGTGVRPLAGVRDFVRYLAVGPVLASGLAALFGAAVYKAGAPDLDYLHYWRVFWFGDALGLLIVGTSLLALGRTPRWWGGAGLGTALEGLALAAGLSAVLAWAFFTSPEIPRVYLVFPFLLWAAVRFGIHGASVAVLATVGVAISSATSGIGPFSSLSTIDVVVALQGLALIVAVSSFLLAFTIEDFWRAHARLAVEASEHRSTAAQLELANEELENANQHLDDVVAERTGDLRETLARNEMLLKEVHHRLKNNLQIVSGLVALQGRTGTAPELSRKVSKQISAIATTYDVIRRMESVEEVDLWRVAAELCRSISASVDSTVNLTCETTGEAIVQTDTAVAFALALNEFLTNSIQHAGSKDDHPTIKVDCRQSGDELVVTISDTGPGFPADFDLKSVKSFGLRMAQRVIARVGGTLRLGCGEQRSTVEVRLPVVTG